MRKLFGLAVLFLVSHFCPAQILKVNKNNLNSDSSNYWLGAFTFDFNLNNRSTTSENENSFIGLTAGADLVYVANKNAYILINQLNYFTSSDNNGAFISTGYAHFRVNWLRKKRLSYETYAQTQYDKGRNMPQRVLVGSGIRYRLVDKKKSKLIVGTGVMFEKERWRQPSNETSIIEKHLWKNSSYINGFSQITDNIKIDIITFYQTGYDTTVDYFRNRINADILISFAINTRLSFNAQFNGQYEDHPIIPINKFIYSVTNGLKWTF